MLEQAGIVMTEAERAGIEVTDFGLGRLDELGLRLLVHVNTERVCAEDLVLLAGRTCPEHRHPSVDRSPDTLHWCRAGDEGAIVSEFSTRSRDEPDVLIDPRIRR
jgi:D-lyxose ketol-isomerase